MIKIRKANESFDNTKTKSYNESNFTKLIEEIINEISNKRIKTSVDNRDELIAGAEKLGNLIRTKKDKELLKDAVIRDQHRVEVVRDKLENRVTDKAKAEYEAGKKKKKEGK